MVITKIDRICSLLAPAGLSVIPYPPSSELVRRLEVSMARKMQKIARSGRSLPWCWKCCVFQSSGENLQESYPVLAERVLTHGENGESSTSFQERRNRKVKSTYDKLYDKGDKCLAEGAKPISTPLVPKADAVPTSYYAAQRGGLNRTVFG